MGRRRRGRALSGVLLLNKPTGITSNKILQMVRRHYQAAKAGHTGSLDPLATGMLPICFGEATKFSQYLLDEDKTYRVTGRLGEKTDTSDADGEIIERCEVSVTEQQLIDCLTNFRGDIMQTPSMYSALKVDGQPLYKLARQGKTVERKARPVTIHQLDFLGYKTPDFQLQVHCSKGTYIRNLVEDIGEALGCGAHVTQLERLAVGGFEPGQWHEWDTIQAITDFQQLDSLLLPADVMLEHLPLIELSTDEAYYLQQGQPISYPDLPGEELLRLYADGEFIGLGEENEMGQLAPRRLVAQDQN